jgi:ethanolamine utilization microcompartment shell protein EutL
MRIAVAGLATLLVAGAVFPGATPAPVRAEIDALLARLEASGCRFGRNREWYAGADARAHLLRKLEYVERVGTIRSAEQFIDVAATKSSVSGAPYQVRCGSAAAVNSASWLRAQLDAIRAARGFAGFVTTRVEGDGAAAGAAGAAGPGTGFAAGDAGARGKSQDHAAPPLHASGMAAGLAYNPAPFRARRRPVAHPTPRRIPETP